jgi:hypothetical protein
MHCLRIISFDITKVFVYVWGEEINLIPMGASLSYASVLSWEHLGSGEVFYAGHTDRFQHSYHVATEFN